MIFAIGKAGYQPLLAHPERYRYIKNPKKEYGRWKDLGVFFQVNINSFDGHYGKHARELALFLSESGMIDYLGSDVHYRKQVKNLNKIFYLDEYKRIFQKNNIRNNELL
jgi:tyrosine-protein phosphatase YwqE